MKVLSVIISLILIFSITIFPTSAASSFDDNYVIKNDETGIPDINFYNAVLNIADLDGDGVITQGECKQIKNTNCR